MTSCCFCIGYYDENGLFFITDRLKELIKVKGFQVAPAELEALLLTHPKIVDVAVIGVPNERLGEAPKAFVVKKEGSLSEKDVQEFIAKKVNIFIMSSRDAGIIFPLILL